MSRRKLTFRGGTQTVLGFVAAFTLAMMGLTGVKVAVADSSAEIRLSYKIGVFAVLAGITLVTLRREDVRVADLGLSSRHVVPAVVTFGGVWVALNLLGVGLAETTGQRWGIGLLRETTPVFDAALPAPRLTTLLLFFLVVGVVEEFAFRGYLQSKVVALVGDDTRPRIALGIVISALVFGLGHVPGALVAGAGIRGALSLVAITAASGIAFGVLYEATQNLYFVALLHGLGDTWPLVVELGDLSQNAFGAFLVGIFATYLTAALAYRYWALGTDLTPVIRRREVGGSASAGGGAISAETRESSGE